MTIDSTQFALTYEGKVTSIDDVSRENRHALGPFQCVGCGAKMVAGLGDKIAHYFRHENRGNCSYETYLHRLGKTVLRDSIQLAMDHDQPYLIEFERQVNCTRFEEQSGKTCDARKVPYKWDATKAFDRVDLERSIGNFRADVLLSSSERPDQNILLEVAVTHPCSEDKIASGLQIVEVFLTDESDVSALKKGISAAAPNVTVHNPLPFRGVCKAPCSELARQYPVQQTRSPAYKPAVRISRDPRPSTFFRRGPGTRF